MDACMIASSMQNKWFYIGLVGNIVHMVCIIIEQNLLLFNLPFTYNSDCNRTGSKCSLLMFCYLVDRLFTFSSLTKALKPDVR